jgi:hypothetical protein
MKDQGGMGYKIPHMGKEKLQNEGELPMALSVDVQLYQRTLEFIAGHESNLYSSLVEEGTRGKSTKRRRHMGKENLQNEGELPMAPSVDAQIYQRTLEIIARRRHMGKEKFQNEGELPMAPSIDAQLYQRNLEIIASHESNLNSSLVE